MSERKFYQLCDEFMAESIKYRSDFIETIIQKYVKSEDHFTIDIHSFSIIQYKGSNRKILSKCASFGFLTEYYCRSGQKILKKLKKEVKAHRKYDKSHSEPDEETEEIHSVSTKKEVLKKEGTQTPRRRAYLSKKNNESETFGKKVNMVQKEYSEEYQVCSLMRLNSGIQCRSPLKVQTKLSAGVSTELSGEYVHAKSLEEEPCVSRDGKKEMPPKFQKTKSLKVNGRKDLSLTKKKIPLITLDKHCKESTLQRIDKYQTHKENEHSKQGSDHSSEDSFISIIGLEEEMSKDSSAIQLVEKHKNKCMSNYLNEDSEKNWLCKQELQPRKLKNVNTNKGKSLHEKSDSRLNAADKLKFDRKFPETMKEEYELQFSSIASSQKLLNVDSNEKGSLGKNFRSKPNTVSNLKVERKGEILSDFSAEAEETLCKKNNLQHGCKSSHEKEVLKKEETQTPSRKSYLSKKNNVSETFGRKVNMLQKIYSEEYQACSLMRLNTEKQCKSPLKVHTKLSADVSTELSGEYVHAESLEEEPCVSRDGEKEMPPKFQKTESLKVNGRKDLSLTKKKIPLITLDKHCKESTLQGIDKYQTHKENEHSKQGSDHNSEDSYISLIGLEEEMSKDSSAIQLVEKHKNERMSNYLNEDFEKNWLCKQELQPRKLKNVNTYKGKSLHEKSDSRLNAADKLKFDRKFPETMKEEYELQFSSIASSQKLLNVDSYEKGSLGKNFRYKPNTVSNLKVERKGEILSDFSAEAEETLCKKNNHQYGFKSSHEKIKSIESITEKNLCRKFNSGLNSMDILKLERKITIEGRFLSNKILNGQELEKAYSNEDKIPCEHFKSKLNTVDKTELARKSALYDVIIKTDSISTLKDIQEIKSSNDNATFHSRKIKTLPCSPTVLPVPAKFTPNSNGIVTSKTDSKELHCSGMFYNGKHSTQNSSCIDSHKLRYSDRETELKISKLHLEFLETKMVSNLYPSFNNMDERSDKINRHGGFSKNAAYSSLGSNYMQYTLRLKQPGSSNNKRKLSSVYEGAIPKHFATTKNKETPYKQRRISLAPFI